MVCFYSNTVRGNQLSQHYISTKLSRLIAATVAPLANVLSIAALVVSWRMSLVPGGRENEHTWNGDPSVLVQELEGIPFGDPKWQASIGPRLLVI